MNSPMRVMALGDIDGDQLVDLVLSDGNALSWIPLTIPAAMEEGLHALPLPAGAPAVMDIKKLAIGELDGNGANDLTLVTDDTAYFLLNTPAM
jgi:hypothetical protein